MEKGNISIMGSHTSDGIIVDEQGRALDFSVGDVIGKDRSRLKEGDAVWFGRQGIKKNMKAAYIKLL